MKVKTPVTIDDARRQAKQTLAGAQKQAKQTVSGAQKQAQGTTKDARKEARSQLIQARIAAARARSGTRAKASRVSAKAIGAAGAVGLAAGYFLDPEAGGRRRHQVRDRTLALVRRGADPTTREAQHRSGQVEGKVEAVKSQSRPENPAPNDQALADRVKSE